jgi:glucosamine kinase
MDSSSIDYSQNDYSTSGPFYLGIDGGGSKTLAIIVDEQGRERGRGLAGSTNYAAVGLTVAVRNIHLAVEQAVQEAHCTLPLHTALLGLAGIDRPADIALLAPQLDKLATTIHLTNDADLALTALDDAVGVVLIAGTGSIAVGCNQAGVRGRVGGWGHILGDEGSGYNIGRRALQMVVRAADGRAAPTLLTDLILQHWRLDRVEDILGEVYGTQDKAHIARLSSCVMQAAQQGDNTALTIVVHAAEELALLVEKLSQNLHFSDQALPLALAGGLLVHEEFFRELVISNIRRHQPIAPPVLVEQPALSAARAAHVAIRL